MKTITNQHVVSTTLKELDQKLGSSVEMINDEHQAFHQDRLHSKIDQTLLRRR